MLVFSPDVSGPRLAAPGPFPMRTMIDTSASARLPGNECPGKQRLSRPGA